ncbi:hypothetical protein JX266_006571 [Neoarthrinium moseri]|nr:hypothetical protein JX266_006571 [Neoarthrinium moseri]
MPHNTRSVLITGCSNGGIGSALALAFSKHQELHVYASARNISKMSDLEAIPNITLVSLDVTSQESAAAAAERLRVARDGRLDYLVNNAGCGYTMPYLDTDIEIARRMFDVNVWGPMRVTQAFSDMLVQARGMVVTIGSTAESLGLAFQSTYCGSKAATHIMSEALRLELEPLGVRHLHVTTSFVKTVWFQNVPEFELPQTSHYRPVQDRVAFMASGGGQATMDVSVYADRVVADVLAGQCHRTFRGKSASLIGWAMSLLPRGLVTQLAAADSGLSELKKIVSEKQ